MRLVVAPSARGSSIYGSAYLRGTRRQRHGRVVLNVDRLVRPCKATLARQLGALPTRLSHEVLVDDLYKLLAEKRPPVAHQPLIGRVVTREILKVIAKRIGLTKQRAIHRETAIQWRAAQKHDICLWKRAPNRPYI